MSIDVPITAPLAWLQAHLAILPVLAPLVIAPLCALFRSGRIAGPLAVAALWASLASSIALLVQTSTTGAISYTLGGWPAPYGIEYRIDQASALVLLTISAVASVITPHSLKSAPNEIDRARLGLYYTALLLCMAGLLGMVATGDLFNLFVFLEISSLSTYALISLGPDRRALNAAFQYLIMGTIGATFILIGVGFLYMQTGTLNMVDFAARLPEVADTRSVRAGFAFLTVGVALKLALFPVHLWLPNAYTFAPAVVSALLAATATKAAAYVLVRLVFTVFGVEFALITMPLDAILMVLGIAALLTGSVIAIFQYELKRLFAYSSIAQIGYLAIGVSYGSATGVAATLVHVFNHALMKGALFLAIGLMVYRLGRSDFHGLRGLGRRMPVTAAALVLGGLSLVGVPPTVGFISKWYLLLGAIEAEYWIAAGMVLFGSLLALIYVWRIIEAAYFQTPTGTSAHHREVPWLLLVPTWVLVLANLWFGLHTEFTVGVAEQAGRVLMGEAGTP